MEKKSEIFKEIKGIIRMHYHTCSDWEDGAISFGKMCEIIAKDIEKHLEDKYNIKEDNTELSKIICKEFWK